MGDHYQRLFDELDRQRRSFHMTGFGCYFADPKTPDGRRTIKFMNGLLIAYGVAFVVCVPIGIAFVAWAFAGAPNF